MKWIIILLGIIIIFNLLVERNSIIEGLTPPPDDVLLGVGVDYNLYTYNGGKWTKITNPPGVEKGEVLAVTLGPDGKLYAAGTDNNLHVYEGSGWTMPSQPSTTKIMSVATENNKLILITSTPQFKLYHYIISPNSSSNAVVNPLPGPTAPVISITIFNKDELGVGSDHKLYKWLNGKWAIYDDKASLLSITPFNGSLVGVGTDNKLYTFVKPGTWDLAASGDDAKLLSVYGMTHTNYVKLGFH